MLVYQQTKDTRYRARKAQPSSRTIFAGDGYFCIVGQVKPRDANNILAKFADDTYLISSAAKRHTILDELEAIHDWASSNNLKLNTSKTKELLFAHGGQWTELQPQLLGLRIEGSLH